MGLCLNRSPEMVIGVLGILKAGGDYVPVEPSIPVERIQYVLEDSGVGAILVQNESSLLPINTACPVMPLENLLQESPGISQQS